MGAGAGPCGLGAGALPPGAGTGALLRAGPGEGACGVPTGAGLQAHHKRCLTHPMVIAMLCCALEEKLSLHTEEMLLPDVPRAA